MGKRKPNTPLSQVRQALRQIWLRSRERAAALKRDNYTCQTCNRKQTMAKGREFKVQVHHKDGIDWNGVTELVAERLLPDPDRLETICKECHEKLHGEEKNRGRKKKERLLDAKKGR